MTNQWLYKGTMLLLSRFSCVRLCATPETAAHQAPLSPGFSSRQEHWSGLPFPSPMNESENGINLWYSHMIDYLETIKN